MAAQLIKTAAARELKHGEILAPPEGAYDEFCARFPYEETEDQLAAIEAVLDDLQKGRPMDRLICGDVGFGKTEVALRSAFVTAMAGKQVAVVVPTTLLARQHFATFSKRFEGLPIRIAQASRLVGRKELGGGAWQARKAKLKERVREMAAQTDSRTACNSLNSRKIETGLQVSSSSTVWKPQATPMPATPAWLAISRS